MLKIVDNDIWRGSTKVGYFSENDIYDEENRKLGYFTSNDIFDVNGRKLGYMEHNNLRTMDGRTMRVDENRKHIQGGTISDLERAAILLLIGD
ncbi:MAG: 4-fold beta flower protein [Patescibacteria group bacterium]